MTEQSKAAEAKNEAKATEKKTIVFDNEAYKTYTELYFERLRRKNQALKKHEEEVFEAAKKKALANKGKRALKTNTYRVKMQRVLLVEGCAVPAEVVDLFPKELQKDLFS